MGLGRLWTWRRDKANRLVGFLIPTSGPAYWTQQLMCSPCGLGIDGPGRRAKPPNVSRQPMLAAREKACIEHQSVSG